MPGQGCAGADDDATATRVAAIQHARGQPHTHTHTALLTCKRVSQRTQWSRTASIARMCRHTAAAPKSCARLRLKTELRSHTDDLYRNECPLYII